MSSPISLRTTATRRCWILARCSRGCWLGWPALGYTAKVGVELEFYLLNPDGSPFQDDIHAYSLENANALDPLLTDLYETLGAFTSLEGIQTEYGPGQVETNLVYTDALEAADDAARLKYAAKEVARKHGKLASFMPKPFTEHSGSSAAPAHLALARRRAGLRAGRRRRERDHPARDRGPARAPAVDHIVRGALGQRLSAIRPGLVRTRDRDVEPRQSQRRSALAGGGRPVGHPDRTAQRRLGRQPVLADRVGPGGGDRRAGSQAQRTAGARAATCTPRASRCPNRSGVAIELATRDDTILEILGADSVLDFAALARSEWVEYSSEVSDWERRRYLGRS